MEKIADPMTAPSLRWGVLGAGWIADAVCTCIRQGTRQELAAVGARDAGRAAAFAKKFGFARSYGSYEQLVNDPDIDVIYIATPHSHHREHALLAINAGKNVLVEKAFTRNAAEAREVVAAAKAKNVFVMEAMWTRFLPHIVALKDLLADGAVGEIINVTADHGQNFPYDPKHRIYAPELAGGALLDLGVYPLSFAIDILGLPAHVHATGSLTPLGVDGQSSVILGYGERRAQAFTQSTAWAHTPTVASVSGTEGQIFIPGSFYTPSSLVCERQDGSTWEWRHPVVSKGYEYEVAEVAQRIGAGEKYSPRITPDDSIAIMEVMDEIRRQLGVVYPGE